MMEFVSWDDDYSQYMESHKSHVPNHQPVILWTEFHVISMLEKCNRPYQWFCAWKLNQWTCRYSDHSPFLSESRVNTIQKFDVSIQSVQAFKTLKLTGSTKFQNYRGKALYQLWWYFYGLSFHKWGDLLTSSWLVVYLPLRKIWVRQLGWWHSQYMESHKSHVSNHQPGHIPTWLLVEPTSIWLHHC